MDVLAPAFDFTLDPALEASSPPEARGLARDEVRLLVSHYGDDTFIHASFRDLPAFLEEGDVLVVNRSATRPASLPGVRSSGAAIRLHLSTQLGNGRWLVELRQPHRNATRPLRDGRTHEVIRLPGAAFVTLLVSHHGSDRLWQAALTLPLPIDDYLACYGEPIRYDYVPDDWPIDAYQTIFADEPGSSEMPSAGRPFTPEIVTRLIRRGVVVLPILLHTGVASLEDHEPPYEEYYHVSAAVARVINAARSGGGRIIPVGTTVVRTLETVAAPAGRVSGGDGWTDLVITPQRGLRAADALLTGFHEPRASHLALLSALAGTSHLERAYRVAVRERYRWHEFGDLHLILP